MLSINGTTIHLTQGDTFDAEIDLKIEKDGYSSKYVPEEGDSIRFAIKSSYKSEEPIILKEIPTDTMRLRLESEETKLLKAKAVPYVYDIELTRADGTVVTFICEAEWYSTNEVH